MTMTSPVLMVEEVVTEVEGGLSRSSSSRMTPLLGSPVGLRLEGDGQGVPSELPAMTFQSGPSRAERAWTCVGRAAHSKFESIQNEVATLRRPSSVGTLLVNELSLKSSKKSAVSRPYSVGIVPVKLRPLRPPALARAEGRSGSCGQAS